MKGYDIPFAADDEIIECGLDDADYADPAEWPTWAVGMGEKYHCLAHQRCHMLR
jgi:hypothetical protein